MAIVRIFDRESWRDTFINTPHITKIVPADNESGHWFVHISGQTYAIRVDQGDSNRLLSAMGYVEEIPARKAEIIRVQLDHFFSRTSDEWRSMWRCSTKEGYTFNIFDHADPLRNTFKLFQDAGYAPFLTAMEYGQIDLWQNAPIACEIRINGDFWNVVIVTPHDGNATPVQLIHEHTDFESDDSDDIPFGYEEKSDD